MIIYNIKNQCEDIVGYIDVKENKIIVSNRNFENEFSNMYDALLYISGNKLNLVPVKTK